MTETVLINDLKTWRNEISVKHLKAFNDDDPRLLARYAGQLDLLDEMIFAYS